MSSETGTMPPKRLLVTGATGYVGGRLIPYLLNAGHQVVAVSRSLKKLQNRDWSNHPNVTLFACDLLEAPTPALVAQLQACDAAYYLVHSMVPGQHHFANADALAAQHFSQACGQAKLPHLIYLGGLGEDSADLSPHLRSRAHVGDVLREGPTPVTVLRAAMIIGSGSASFEILRYLVDRLPIMVTPAWVNTPTQPIAIRNVLTYLVNLLDCPEAIGHTFDIGSPEVLNYRQLMEIYAEESHHKIKLIIPVPVFTPKISSYWINFITPVHASIAQPLAEGLRNPTICQNNTIQALIPQVLLTPREAIRLALQRTQAHEITTHWTDAGQLPPPEYVYPGDPTWAGGTLYQDVQQTVLKATLEEVWRPVVKIGGETGWYYGNLLWKLRGLMDLFFGGVGLRGGRRHPTDIHVGDALDFWRVLEIDAPRKLKLMAEMKVPGEAYLEFELTPGPDNTVCLKQTARFVPHGLLGVLYWYAVTPLHYFVFNGMLNGIVKAGKLTRQAAEMHAPP